MIFFSPAYYGPLSCTPKKAKIIHKIYEALIHQPSLNFTMIFSHFSDFSLEESVINVINLKEGLAKILTLL